MARIIYGLKKVRPEVLAVLDYGLREVTGVYETNLGRPAAPSHCASCGAPHAPMASSCEYCLSPREGKPAP